MANQEKNHTIWESNLYVPWSKVAILGMVIPPFNRNPYNGYINPYYWVDYHPLLYANNGSLDPGIYIYIFFFPAMILIHLCDLY